MTEICVVIDCSGSMTSMSKKDIVKGVCRNLFLHEEFKFKFYAWSDSVTEIVDGNVGLEFECSGTNRLSTLVQFIQNDLKSSGNILLLTDGFIDEDKTEFTSLVRDSQNLKLRVVGIGADINKERLSFLFPKNFVATSSDKECLIFSTLDLEAALESFYEK